MWCCYKTHITVKKIGVTPGDTGAVLAIQMTTIQRCQKRCSRRPKRFDYVQRSQKRFQGQPYAFLMFRDPRSDILVVLNNGDVQQPQNNALFQRL